MGYLRVARKVGGVLAIGVCQTASVQNDLNFGAAAGDAIRAGNRRVVLVASGGLSHKFWGYDHARERAAASPEGISSPAHRAYDERVMEWFRAGRHDEVIAHAAEFRAQCSPEGRFSHYLMMAGAMGGARWNGRGEQFGRYEAALGTGQAIFYFARPTPAAPQGAHAPAGGAKGTPGTEFMRRWGPRTLRHTRSHKR